MVKFKIGTNGYSISNDELFIDVSADSPDKAIEQYAYELLKSYDKAKDATRKEAIRQHIVGVIYNEFATEYNNEVGA